MRQRSFSLPNCPGKVFSSLDRFTFASIAKRLYESNKKYEKELDAGKLDIFPPQLRMERPDTSAGVPLPPRFLDCDASTEDVDRWLQDLRGWGLTEVDRARLHPVSVRSHRAWAYSQATVYFANLTAATLYIDQPDGAAEFRQ